jgi:biopolymer transport protein TolR
MPEATINMTSLLDITFVLLIAFMVVAPALRYDVGLTLPKVSEGAPSTSKDRPVALQIKRGENSALYFVNGKGVEFPQIISTIKGSTEFAKDPTVSLEADQQAPWQDVAAVMALLKANEINQVSVVTEVRQQR